MSEIRVVTTGLTHVPGYHAVLDEVARERRHLALLEAPSLADSTRFVEWLLNGAGLHCVAITASNEVIGWCDVIRNPRIGFTHVGQLGMGIRASHRRRGIGRLLVEETVAGLGSLGVQRLELEVFRSNTAAVRLYESLGFIHEGAKINARMLDGIADDVLLMARRFPMAIE